MKKIPIKCGVCGKELNSMSDPHVESCGNIALWRLTFGGNNE
jgi:hypothetical protein